MHFPALAWDTLDFSVLAFGVAMRFKFDLSDGFDLVPANVDWRGSRRCAEAFCCTFG